MPSAGRSGDRASIEHDSHGCPCCPHGTSGSAVVGSGNVFVNGSKALRLGDQGTHGGCCGSSSWRAAMGWGSVLVNGKPIHCQGDATEHCGGIGALSAGSPDVIVGEWVSRGGRGRGGTVFRLQIETPMFLQVPVGGIYVSPQQTLAAITAFRHGLQAGLGALVGQAAQVAMRYGLGRLFRLLDRIGAPIGSILEKVVVFFGDYIPYISDVLRWTRAGFQLVVNTLFDYWGAAPLHGPCPEAVEVGPPTEVDRSELVMNATENEILSNVVGNIDVSLLADRLLRAFRPVFVEHPDDHRAVSMEELLEHSRLVPLPADEESSPRTLEKYAKDIEALERANPSAEADEALATLDIDESFGRDPGPVRSGELPVYYCRAIKCSDLELSLQYFALRSGSFFGNMYVDQDLYEHEGDGEGVCVIIKRRSPGDPWLLAGLLFDGKHYRRNCSAGKACEKNVEKGSCCAPACNEATSPFLPGDKMRVACEVDDTNRPLVYVAIGSHATGPTAGKRRHTGIFVDYYPKNEARNRVSTYTLVPSSWPHVRDTVFTKRVRWGKDALLFTKTYPGYEDIAGAEDATG